MSRELSSSSILTLSLFFFSLFTLRRLIRSHFFVTGAAKCPASLFCLRHLLQLSRHHCLPRHPVRLISLAPLITLCSSFNSDLLNGSPRPFEDMSVVEIKERAIQQAQRASRGSSAISLIRSAKGQISLAQSCESTGDLKGALSAFTKAASLTQVFMDTADFKAENVPGKRGVLWKEFTDFQQVSCSPPTPSFTCILITRTIARG